MDYKITPGDDAAIDAFELGLKMATKALSNMVDECRANDLSELSVDSLDTLFCTLIEKNEDFIKDLRKKRSLSLN